MNVLLDRLRQGLSPDYLIERELASGGLGIVFLGRDIQLDRPVAVKVLRPERATANASARFVREARILAKLSHPNIVPIHHAGEIDGMQYYVMDFIAGETLGSRLDRGPLPFDEVLAVGANLLDALAEAHRHGVIHRDVKPSNIFLADGRAILADFGIADSVDSAEESLTEPGRVVGTMAYMAPEQFASGDITVRTDLYVLGLVLYEAATGRRWGVTSDPDHVDWSGVPDPSAEVLKRALAWRPDVRWPDAPSFRQAWVASAGATSDIAAVPVPEPIARKRLSAGLLVSLGLVLPLLIAAVWGWRQTRLRETVGTGDRLAVFPFGVAGTDSSLGYLREGMVDLLAAKFSSSGGPSVVDAASTIRAWRQIGGTEQSEPPETALRVAASRLSATRFVSGSVLGNPRHLTITLRLSSVGGGSSRRGTVEGPADSLDPLLNRVAALLLSIEADEAAERLPTLTTVPLSALEDYLRGQAALRRGAIGEAADLFMAALRADSSFALAGLWFAVAGARFGHPDRTTGLRWAWAARTQLPSRDRQFLEALLRSSYPTPGTLADVFAAWEAAANSNPDRSQVWFELGDLLYRFGDLAGRVDAWPRALRALEKGIALDSAYGPALIRLVEVSGSLKDSAAVRTYGQRFLAVDSSGQLSDYVRWLMAVARGDSVWRREFRTRFGRLAGSARESHANALTSLVWTAQLDGVALEDAQSAIQALMDAAITDLGRVEQQKTAHDLALNRGQPARATRLISQMASSGLALSTFAPTSHLINALYWDGDSTAAAKAAAHWSGLTNSPRMTEETVTPACLTEQWRLTLGDTSSARRTIGWLRNPASPRDTATVIAGRTCAIVLEAILAVRASAPDADRRLQSLDSLLMRGYPDGLTYVGGHLILARLAAERGQYQLGLAAARRHWHWGRVLYLSSFLREEARLAALVADTVGAIRAWKHYLALRSDPEPALKADAAHARAELARLEARR